MSYGQMGVEYRSYPELFFSGALTEQQVDDMYKLGQGRTTCDTLRWINLGTSRPPAKLVRPRSSPPRHTHQHASHGL